MDFGKGHDFRHVEAAPPGDAARFPPSEIAFLRELFRVVNGGLDRLHPRIPHHADRRVIVRGIRHDAEPVVAFAGDELPITFQFPLRHAEAGDAEFQEARAHVFRNGSEVFADERVRAADFDEHFEKLLAERAIRGAMLGRVVLVRAEMREVAAGARLGFFEREREKFRIQRGPPREAVDAVKAEDVINAKEVKNFAHFHHALTPPVEIALPQLRPVVKRYPPVLAPFVGERIGFKNPLRRRSSAPAMIENLVIRPHIGAVVRNAEWDVAHERDVERIGLGAERCPLRRRDPLHPHREAHLVGDLAPKRRRLRGEPLLRSGKSALLLRPHVPAFAALAFIHEHAEKRVGIEPRRLGAQEGAEAARACVVLFPARHGEPRERPLQQRALERLHDRVCDGAGAECVQIDVLRRVRKIFLRQIGERARRRLDRRGIERDG